MLRFALLFVAIIAGAGAAWLAIQIRSQPAVTIAAPAPPAQPLSNENMRWQPWPENAVNPVYITRSQRPDALETLSGSLVRSRMTSGEPIRDENLAPRHSGFLAAILPSGKRAVAVRISAENTAGGFILPNDRVDVLHSEGENVTRTILRN